MPPGIGSARRAAWRLRCGDLIGTAIVMAVAVIVLQFTVIAAQLLVQMIRRLFGAENRVGVHRFGPHHDTGIEVKHAFRAKAESLLADGGVPGKAAALE